MNESMLISPSRQRWILISVAFTSFIVALDTYIVNVSLPAIAHYFNVGTSDVVHVMVAYLLIITSTLPLFGKLGDRFGFKKFFVLGFCFFHRRLSFLRDFPYPWHSYWFPVLTRHWWCHALCNWHSPDTQTPPRTP